MSGVPGTDRVKPAGTGVKLTYDDLLRMPDDGKRHELIGGEHFVTPSPNLRHQRISGRLYLLIGSWLEANPLGEIFYAPLDVVMSNVDVVEPDLLYMTSERAAEIATGIHVHGVPELLVEIASPGTRRRDETIKRALYERKGVTEYWVVDPVIDAVRVYRRDGDRFARVVEFSRNAGDVLTTPLLPGLEIPLERLFRE
jgi:Uma2 family endonuclease